MSTRNAVTPGMPCWADVSSSDPKASRDFYAGLFGWKYEMGSGYYTIALAGGMPVAALSGVPAKAGEHIAWTLYLASGNIRETAAAITGHGGRVLHGPVKIPGQGTMLFGRDPAGAGVGFWQPGSRWRSRLFEPSALWWAELYTPQPQAADSFYAELFDYERTPFGDDGSYMVWSLNGTPYLGRAAARPEAGGVTEAQAAHWHLYFVAPAGTGTDQAAARAEELGGSIRKQPFDHTHGRAAVLADPAGATFTLIEPNRAAS